MTLREILKEGEAFLRSHDIEEAATDAWLLLEWLTGINRTVFLLDGRKEANPETQKNYQAVLEKRAAHIPLQHITGEQNFMGFPFQVNGSVLVPRQDTEILVEEALKRIHCGMKILDMCTGSGCIGISLERLGKEVLVDAVDLSEDALRVAKKNAENNHSQVRFIQSDLFVDVDAKYDMIVSNPPYIPTEEIKELSEEVRVHEPFMALDGKEDGLYFYRKILEQCREYLTGEGWVLFEIGCDQAEQVSAMMEMQRFREIQVVQDLAGLDRVVIGRI